MLRAAAPWTVRFSHPACIADLILLAANAQIYIFINDADDRVVECISISGLWS